MKETEAKQCDNCGKSWTRWTANGRPVMYKSPRLEGMRPRFCSASCGEAWEKSNLLRKTEHFARRSTFNGN